jgi:8-oxo-dGTP pyrophosphatase MutT (NUDIX family)
MSSERQRGSRGPRKRAPRRPAHERPARERSAGGVVVRGGEVVVIVPTRRASDGSKVLALPKGHIDPGETVVQAATREVREETGIEAELVDDLGEISYRYVRSRGPVDKVVHFYLFRYRSGDVADHDHEIEQARWMPMAEAVHALSYEGERQMVARALSRTAADR